jgi:hypothetical protein
MMAYVNSLATTLVKADVWTYMMPYDLRVAARRS